MTMTIEQRLESARERIRRYEPAEALTAQGEGAIIIDTRDSADRAREGMIEGAVWITRTTLEWRCDPSSPARDPRFTDPDVPLIVVCNDGYSSSLAAESLVDLGFADAGDLVGGHRAWRRAGLPVLPAAGHEETAPPRRLALDLLVAEARKVARLLDSVVDWNATGLGTWDVAGLAGHTLRAVERPVTYIAAATQNDNPGTSAADYLVSYLDWRDHDPDVAEAAIAGRGREMAARSPDSLASQIRLHAETLAALTDADLTSSVSTPFGVLRVGDYLETRLMEMVVHGLDLSRASGVDYEPGPEALAMVIGLLGRVASGRRTATQLLLALTGRVPPEHVLPVLR